MFRNSNTGMEKELAAENYKAHPVRNRIAVLGVVLSAMLITVVFTIGFSLVRTVALSENASPGPGADSNCIYGDEIVLERIRELPQVEWAALARRCSSTFLHNKEFSGLEVRLFAADEVHYDKNMVELIAGKYPEKAEEILLSDTISDKLGLSQETGIIYPLTVVVQEGEEEIEKVIPMTVCGYYKNPLRNISNVYEEIYTDESFIDTYNPELLKGHDSIYVKLNNLSIFKLGHDKEEKLEEVRELAGGSTVGYKMSSMSGLFLVPIFGVIFLIMLCSYFFIYNIFDISIENDIRFFGCLKTIGMTSGQLRRMLLYQMNRIAFMGIIMGSIGGYILGKVSSETIVRLFAEGVSGYYQTAGAVQTFVMSAVFSWITVYISTMKPFRKAGNISPVEAARYGNKRKKGVFSVISFALSGILFLLVYTLGVGYNVDKMVERYNETDFRIFHKGGKWSQDEAYEPISQELIKEIENLPFTENVSVLYQARTRPDYLSGDWGVLYLSSFGEIAKEGELARDMEAYNAVLGEESGYRFAENERGNYQAGVVGIDAEILNSEGKYIGIIEGELDEDKFAGGGYMIYMRSGPLGDFDQGEGMGYRVHAGDEVTVTFYDDAADRYVTKNLTVMAVTVHNCMFGTSNIAEGNIIITDKVFQSIYSDYENLASIIRFDASGYTHSDGSKDSETEQMQYEAVREILEEDGNLQLEYDSKYETRIKHVEEKRVIGIFGLFLAGILGLIGISNVVNTIVTDVMARKIEYAAMQSIGMTGKQMERDIFKKCSRYVLTAAGLAAIAGAPFTFVIGKEAMFTGFAPWEFAQALVLFVLFSVLLCAVIARLLTKVLNKKSVVERLREIA